MLSPIHWNDGKIRIIEQTLLPNEERWVDLVSIDQLADAICRLAIRGAPEIGVAAAMGCTLAATLYDGNEASELTAQVHKAADQLGATRPTAVNLFWALTRMRKKLDALQGQDVATIREGLLNESQAIREEDIGFCKAIGRYGAALLPDDATVITHCNAGALATAGYGTALGVVRAAVEAGKKIRVYADETRPLLQGARLTTWELMKDGIDVTLICDNAAGYVMRKGGIDACVVGADRIAANGDAANKIGTYSLAVLARRHGIPFYVAAPYSTVDFSLPTGDQIPIEERDPSEVSAPRGTRFAPEGVTVFNPAFDVTPASLISAIITDRGVVDSQPLGRGLRDLAQSSPDDVKV